MSENEKIEVPKGLEGAIEATKKVAAGKGPKCGDCGDGVMLYCGWPCVRHWGKVHAHICPSCGLKRAFGEQQGKCKGFTCPNSRRAGSAYCQECSDIHHGRKKKSKGMLQREAAATSVGQGLDDKHIAEGIENKLGIKRG